MPLPNEYDTWRCLDCRGKDCCPTWQQCAACSGSGTGEDGAECDECAGAGGGHVCIHDLPPNA
jgi:hypothetical protein